MYCTHLCEEKCIEQSSLYTHSPQPMSKIQWDCLTGSGQWVVKGSGVCHFWVEAIESFDQLIYLFPCSGHQKGQIVPERAAKRC